MSRVHESFISSRLFRTYSNKLARWDGPCAWFTKYPQPLEPLSLFPEGGLDRCGNLYGQGCFCRRGESKRGAHLFGKHHFRRFYRVGGAIGGSPHNGVHQGYRLSSCSSADTSSAVCLTSGY